MRLWSGLNLTADDAHPERRADSRRTTEPSYRPPDPVEARVLEAATEQFGSLGYERATVAQIAKQARLSTSTLRAKFGLKKDVYVFALDVQAERMIELAATATVAGGSSRDPEAGVSAFIEFVGQSPMGWRILFDREPRNPGLAAIRAEVTDEAMRWVTPSLAARSREESLAAFAILNGTAEWWLANPDVGREEVISDAVTMLRSVLAGRTATFTYRGRLGLRSRSARPRAARAS